MWVFIGSRAFSLDVSIVPMGEPKLECFGQDSGDTAEKNYSY